MRPVASSTSRPVVYAGVCGSAPTLGCIDVHNCQPQDVKPYLIAALAVAALSGCAIQSPIWTDSNEYGPPTGAGQSTRQVQRCNVVQVSPWATTGGTWCDYAFRSQDGSITTFASVRSEIEATVSQALPLRPFLVAFYKDFYPLPAGRQPYQRYRLYLVGLRPSVVVGVPIEVRESDGCDAPGGTECMRFTERSEEARGRAKTFGIYYSRRPPVKDGSFVLVPEWKAESVALRSDAPVETIRSGNAVISLVNRDGAWQLQQR